ncbi:hypothetical protein [Tumebacillus flagellatus]|uniref:Uncharacterized protein n=1 Tax=Tumebacillus flagellatus TaxID=1157490 RepID=A0A074LN76_9BACL|nr:hypothetical protein [Tumebacillus flagellatus]KEO83561.1 hypothetical protein EL26_09105 [Tumebacillus flagellatus]
MRIISTFAHLQQFKLVNNFPKELADIIESEFQSLMSVYSTEAAHDALSLDEHYIRFFVLEEELEFFTLIASLISPPFIGPLMYRKPEYAEILSSGQTEVCKVCYLLDNECYAFLYALHTESIAAWIREHIEGEEN